MVKTVDRLESDIPMSAGEGAVLFLMASSCAVVGGLIVMGVNLVRQVKNERKQYRSFPNNPGRQRDDRPQNPARSDGRQQHRPGQGKPRNT